MRFRLQNKLNFNHLLDGLREGKTEIIDYLIQKIQPKVTRLVVLGGGSEQDAEDIFAGVLLDTFKKLEQDAMPRIDNLEGYLYKACKNKFSNHQRDLKNRRKNLETYRYKLQHQQPLDASEQMIEQEIQTRIQWFFCKLSPQCQEILKMRYQKESYTSIQISLGLGSPDYVKKKKSECFKKLSNLLHNDPWLKDFLGDNFLEE